MATATINGKPSVFITPIELPTARIDPTADLQNHRTDAVRIANEMATELSTADTEMTDEDYFNDPEFQAEYNEWYEKLDEQWRNDPEAQRKFEEWCDEQERLADEEAELEALCEAHDAEASELVSLGCAAGHYFAGHDQAWQAGVNL